MFDEEVRKWIVATGVESLGKNLVNAKGGPPTFEKPRVDLSRLMEFGDLLVAEQENVKRVQLADAYLDGAELGNSNVQGSVVDSYVSGTSNLGLSVSYNIS